MLEDSLQSRLGRPFVVYFVNWPRLTLCHFDFYFSSHIGKLDRFGGVTPQQELPLLACFAYPEYMDSSLNEQRFLTDTGASGTGHMSNFDVNHWSQLSGEVSAICHLFRSMK